MNPRSIISGRKARRANQFAQRRKGAGWTRSYRKGRDQRTPDTERTHEIIESGEDAIFIPRKELDL